MNRYVPLLAFAWLGALSGCSSGVNSQQPMSAAPPVASGSGSMGASGSMGSSGAAMSAETSSAPASNVYNWSDVPQGTEVPITRGMFDLNGYQLFASTGETIAVPFRNQNLYVMQFGRSQTGQAYFINTGSVPILYLPRGAYLENAMASGARWYPIPDDFAYSQPMYVGLAPSWNDYVGMGWYPGMTIYGGRWGYHPGFGLALMPMFVINIGGSRYRSYATYHTYYTTHHNYVQSRRVMNYTVTGRPGMFHGSARTSGGSFGSGTRRPFGGSSSMGTRPATGNGSFGQSSSGFSRTPAVSGGSFGGTRRPFGGSFGSSRPSGGSSFGSSRPSGGSFFGSSRPSGGSSFGSSRPSGGGSFSRPSSGGSFGSKRH